MFSVVFEVYPKTEQWDAYLGNAKMLRPELERTLGWDAFDAVLAPREAPRNYPGAVRATA